MIRRPPRSTQSRSSAASDVYKRQPCQSRSAATEPLQRRYILSSGGTAGACQVVPNLQKTYTCTISNCVRTRVSQHPLVPEPPEQVRALSFFCSLLIAGWALLVHQTVRFTIVGRLSWGHRCNTLRIGMPKLSRPPNVMFYNSWALLVHQTVRFTIVGRLSGGRRCNTWRIGMPKLFRLSLIHI